MLMNVCTLVNWHDVKNSQY